MTSSAISIPVAWRHQHDSSSAGTSLRSDLTLPSSVSSDSAVHEQAMLFRQKLASHALERCPLRDHVVSDAFVWAEHERDMPEVDYVQIFSSTETKALTADRILAYDLRFQQLEHILRQYPKSAKQQRLDRRKLLEFAKDINQQCGAPKPDLPWLRTATEELAGLLCTGGVAPKNQRLATQMLLALLDCSPIDLRPYEQYVKRSRDAEGFVDLLNVGPGDAFQGFDALRNSPGKKLNLFTPEKTIEIFDDLLKKLYILPGMMTRLELLTVIDHYFAAHIQPGQVAAYRGPLFRLLIAHFAVSFRLMIEVGMNRQGVQFPHQPGHFMGFNYLLTRTQALYQKILPASGRLDRVEFSALYDALSWAISPECWSYINVDEIGDIDKAPMFDSARHHACLYLRQVASPFFSSVLRIPALR